MNDLNYRKVADFFKAFSHSTRVAIIAELLDSKKCVTDIKELVKVKQPNISQHLSLLKLNGIVEWGQEGKRKCYFLRNPQLMRDILKALKKNRFYNFRD